MPAHFTTTGSDTYPAGHIIQTIGPNWVRWSGDVTGNPSDPAEIDSDMRCTITGASTSNKFMFHFMLSSGWEYHGGSVETCKWNIGESANYATTILSDVWGQFGSGHSTGRPMYLTETITVPATSAKTYSPTLDTDGQTTYINWNGGNGWGSLMVQEIKG